MLLILKCLFDKQFDIDKLTMKESLVQNDDALSVESILESNTKKGMIARYFGPIHDGSLRGSIFALLASAMGTGIFNLPLRVAEIGIIPFIFFALLNAVFSYGGMIMMSKLIKKYHFESYSQMALEAIGQRFMRVAQFCIIFYPWGITICFQVILAKFVCQLLNDSLDIDLYSDRNNQEYNSTGNLVRILINIGAILISLPLSLQKTMGLLQKLSFLGVASSVYNFLVIIITSISGFKRKDDETVYNGIFSINWSKVNWFAPANLDAASLMAQGLASIMFCYVSHQLLFPLAMGLARPTHKRMKKIITRVHITEYFIYLFIGIVGYLLLLEHQDDHPIGAMVITSIPIIPITIGKLLMVFALFLAIPLNIFPSRESIFEAELAHRNRKNHILLTVSMSLVSCAISIGFQKVNSYFGLLGGTAGVMMAGGIPAICYFKLSNKLKQIDGLLLGISVTVTIFAMFGALLSVIAPI